MARQSHDSLLSSTTKVLGGALALAIALVIAVLSWSVIRANQAQTELYKDIKTQTRICLQTPGCVVERGYAITSIRCVVAESDQFWQINWRDNTQSIVTATCKDQAVPFAGQDAGEVPVAPTPVQPTEQPQGSPETPAEDISVEPAVDTSSDSNPSLGETSVTAPAQPAPAAPEPAPAQPAAPAPVVQTPLLSVGTNDCLVESSLLGRVLCKP